MASGCGATSVHASTEAAAVSRATASAVFGDTRPFLKAAHDIALVGDDDFVFLWRDT